MRDLTEALAKHQRHGTGMTHGSPDRCACGAEVYPEAVDYIAYYTEHGAEPPGITVRRDVAFARHQSAEVALHRVRTAWPIATTPDLTALAAALRAAAKENA